MKPTPMLLASLQSLLLLVPVLISMEPPTQPQFLAERAEGPPIEGKLGALGKDWQVSLGEGKNSTIPAGDLISLRQKDVSLPSMPEQTHLVLVQGDLVPIRHLRIVNERLYFQHPLLNQEEPVTLSLSSVAMIWFRQPLGATVDVHRRRLLNEPRKRDAIHLLNSDTLEGDLIGIDGTHATLENGKKRTQVELKQIAVIVFNGDLAEKKVPTGSYAQAILLPSQGWGSTRIHLREAGLEGAQLVGKTLFGATLKVPLGQLASLDILQGKAVYLSELKPVSYEFKPFLDLHWPLGVNASVSGRDLSVGDSVYSLGLGMHARSQVRYRLDNPFRRMEAIVGLDRVGGKLGSARVQVLVDGKEIGKEGNLLDETHPVQTIQIPLGSARELTLVTDFGPRGDVLSRVNWVMARLIR